MTSHRWALAVAVLALVSLNVLYFLLFAPQLQHHLIHMPAGLHMPEGLHAGLHMPRALAGATKQLAATAHSRRAVTTTPYEPAVAELLCADRAPECKHM